MTIYIEPSAYGINDSSVIYRNLFGEGALSWSSQTADGSAANALGPQTYDAWVPASLPAWIAVAGGASDADCAALIGHTLGTNGCTAYVETSGDAGATWDVRAQVTPEDDADIFVLFDTGSPIGFTHWRIRITGSGSAPAVSIAWVGPRLFIPMGVQSGYVPINHGTDIQLSIASTIGGQYVGAYIERKGGGTSISLAPQDRSWVQADAAAFIDHYNHGKPFLWISCPARLPEDAHYVWRSGGVMNISAGAGAKWFDMSMEVNAYVA